MTTNVSCFVKVNELLSNVYKNLQADYKVKIDDIKNRIDIELNRLNGMKSELVIVETEV